jgi:hypothetical protein
VAFGPRSRTRRPQLQNLLADEKPLGIHHLDVVIFWLITPYNCDAHTLQALVFPRPYQINVQGLQILLLQILQFINIRPSKLTTLTMSPPTFANEKKQEADFDVAVFDSDRRSSIDTITALVTEDHQHEIKLRTMSWQKAAWLLAGDQVCLAIMAQTWSLS